jgi:ribonuclease-3
MKDFTKKTFSQTKLQKNISYSFQNPELLILALTHPSFNEHDERKADNQRMEFLGDSILGAILAEALYQAFPKENEGSLSRKKAVFVRGSFLSKVASDLKLDRFVLMSESEIKNNGHKRSSTLEDTLEALIGAIFLDGGMQETRNCVLKWFGDLPGQLRAEQPKYNPKGQLQEMIKDGSMSKNIEYRLIKEEGPPHQKKFAIDLIVGKKTLGSGVGKTKKEAEEKAALLALSKISKEVKNNSST